MNSNNSSEPKKPMSWQEGIAWIAIALIAAIWGSLSRPGKTEELAYKYFETIYYGKFLLCAGICALLAFLIVKKTRPTLKRRTHLKRFGPKTVEGISVGFSRPDELEIALPDDVRSGHVQILGSTGRGKTKSVIIPWALQDLFRGQDVLIIDGKGDSELGSYFDAVWEREVERNGGQKVFEIDLVDLGRSDSFTISPLSHGTPQAITDRLFRALTFSDEYYKSRQLEIVGNVVALIQARTQSVTFKLLHTLLTDDRALTEGIIALPDSPLRRALRQHLSISRTEREKVLSGVVSQIAPFAIGELSALVNGGPSTGVGSISELMLPELRFCDSDLPRIMVIMIPTLKYQESGKILGKILLQELGWTIGERASRGGRNYKTTPVFLDEFSAFVYPGFENILNKARSSQVPLHLSHQSQGDLEAVSDAFAKIIGTNTNVKCILGLNDPETADFFARHMGTQKSTKETERVKRGFGLFRDQNPTGELSVREVDEYKIHPNKLKSYTRGTGVLHFPAEDGMFTEEIQFHGIRDIGGVE